MSQTGKLPRPGEFYRYQGNRLCQVAAVAEYAGNGEPLVVCQELFGAYRVVVWPLEAFMQKAEDGECRDSGHKDCFQKVSLTADKGAYGEPPASLETADEGVENPGEAEPALNPDLLAFFEAMDEKDYDAMSAALDKLSKKITDKEIEDICMVMDLKRTNGDSLSQIAAIRKQILMLKKFDGVRLR